MPAAYRWVVQLVRGLKGEGQDRETARDLVTNLHDAWPEDVDHAIEEVYGLTPEEWDERETAEEDRPLGDSPGDSGANVQGMRSDFLSGEAPEDW